MNAPTPTPAIPQPRPAAKHTEGPWKIKKDRFSQSVWAGNERIAEMMGWGKDRRRANARLIAKAPDMFSAIQDIISSAQANDANSLAEAINIAERVINA